MGWFDAKKISTQQHLDIEDIRDDMVVLKNGKVSIVIETTAINFDLLDTKEQDARIGTFAGLLNSIRFPIQIVIRTQRTDIAKYLQLLETYKSRAETDGLANQVNLYQNFIKNLTQSTQILDKRFFTVIPSVKLAVINNSWFKQVLGKQKTIVNISEILKKAKDELYPKRDHLIRQFENMGLSAKQLTNDELIKLYYTVYDPDQTGLETVEFKEKELEQGLVRGN